MADLILPIAVGFVISAVTCALHRIWLGLESLKGGSW